jgi:hypothetical protein
MNTTVKESQMNKELLCKDCVNAIYPSWTQRIFLTGVTFSRCRLNYTEPKYDLVTGTYGEGKYEYAGASRANALGCGPDAKWWTPRHKHGLFTLIKHIK